MKSTFKPLLLAGLLAGLGLAASAQGMGSGGAMQHEGMMMQRGSGDHQMGAMDPARMQAMMDRHHARLKAKLKITADQEGAWTTFTNAMKPAPDAMKRHEELRAEMDKRADAVKAFYAVLTPYQKGVFDSQAMHGHGRRGHGTGPKR